MSRPLRITGPAPTTEELAALHATLQDDVSGLREDLQRREASDLINESKLTALDQRLQTLSQQLEEQRSSDGEQFRHAQEQIDTRFSSFGDQLLRLETKTDVALDRHTAELSAFSAKIGMLPSTIWEQLFGYLESTYKNLDSKIVASVEEVIQRNSVPPAEADDASMKSASAREEQAPVDAGQVGTAPLADLDHEAAQPMKSDPGVGQMREDLQAMKVGNTAPVVQVVGAAQAPKSTGEPTNWADDIEAEERLQEHAENLEIEDVNPSAKIPKFREYDDDSDEAVDQWLRDFEDVLRDAKVSKTRWPLAVSTYLKGTPLSWWHRFRSLHPTYFYSTFKEDFLRTHMERDPGSAARRKVKNITFKDMDSLIETFRKALILAPPGKFTDAEWIDRFCEKLPARYHDLVRDIKRNKLRNLDAVFNEARDFDDGNLAARNAIRSGPPPVRAFPWKRIERSATIHVLNKGKRPQKPKARSSPNQPLDRRRRLPDEPANVATATTECYECHGKGHFARDCIRRQKKVGLHVMAMTEGEDLPKLRVQLPNDITASALLDTGASHNFVAKDFIQYLTGAGVRVPVKDEGEVPVQTASGVVSSTTLKATVPLLIQGRNLPFDAYVIDLHEGCDFSLIAGLPFLKKFGAEFSWTSAGLVLSLQLANQRLMAKWKVQESGISRSPPSLEVFRTQAQPKPVLPATEDAWRDQLAAKFPNLFSGSLNTDPSKRAKVEHEIELTDPHPIRLPPRRRSPAEDRAIHDFIEESLANGTIRRSTSSWSSPVHIVPKPDGRKRVTIDYRALNRVTRRDAYPIPRADDSLNLLAGSKYFTSLDFLNGFWQIPMKEEHKAFTAFSCRYGHFEWNVMPMGLTNAPATFQRAMNDVLAEYIDKCCIVYLDDITIFSPDLSTHHRDVEKVCRTLEAAGFVLSLHKCHFAQEEIKMLGHIISKGETVKPNPAKIEAISNWPLPSDITQLRGFLNVCGYYRRFVKNFAHVAEPLYALTEGSPRRRAPIEMSLACRTAFDELKDHLKTVVLALPQLDRRYYLETDASDFAIGAVLSQVRRDWTGRQFADRELPPKTALQPVAFFSKRLTKTERNYSARERELLGGIASMEHHRCFIEGAPGGFTWITDHQGIVYFRTQRELTPREYRYLDKIEQYDPVILYRKGGENVVADALSRRTDLPETEQPSDQPLYAMATRRQTGPTELEQTVEQEGDGTIAARPSDGDRIRAEFRRLHATEDLTMHYSAISLAALAVYQGTTVDEALQRIGNLQMDDALLSRCVAKAEEWMDRLVWHLGRLHWETREGLLLPVLSSLDEASSIAIALHDEGGHRGADTLVQLLRDRYWLPLSRQIAKAVVSTCISCQVAENPKRVVHPLHPLPRMDAFERWGLDFLTLPRSSRGNTKILTAVDYCTGQAHALPCRSENKDDVIRVMEQLIHRYGKPSSVVADNGPAFSSMRFRAFCAKLGIRILFISPHHPQTNGKVERLNGILLRALKRVAYQNQAEWDTPAVLNQVLFGYRATRSTMTGESPFFLMYGRHPRFRHQATTNTHTQHNVDREDELRLRLTRAQRFEKIRAGATLRAKQLMERRALLREQRVSGEDIALGDIVLARNHSDNTNKFSPPWSGPYLVADITPEGAVELITRRGRTLRQTFNVSDLKLARLSSDDRATWFPRHPSQQPSYLGEASLLRWDLDDNDAFPQSAANDATFLTDHTSASPEDDSPRSPTPEASTSQAKGKERQRRTHLTMEAQEVVPGVEAQTSPGLPVRHPRSSMNALRQQAGLLPRRPVGVSGRTPFEPENVSSQEPTQGSSETV